MTIIKGYKAFDINLKCHNFQFEIGHTYFMPKSDVHICKGGFHFCRDVYQLFHFKDIETDGTRVCEITAEIVQEEDDKCVTNLITVGRELGYLEIFNAPYVNRGYNNWGIHNMGCDNIGHYNRGNLNIGNYNHGNENIGCNNAGNHNRGNNNEGNYNIGSDNRGHHNYNR